MKYYNVKHKLKIYNVRDLMMLSTKNLCVKHSSKKLFHKFIESFRVQDLVKKQIYCLIFSLFYWIHNIFHVSYLKLYECQLSDESALMLQLLKLINDNEKYEIEEIVEKQNYWKEI